MLPSTGNFKEINCPFFDSGLCERPYCHYRHVRKDPTDLLQASSVSIGSTALSSISLGENGEILQQLVSEAVRKVLEQTDIKLTRPSTSASVDDVSRSLVSKVTEVLTPPLAAPTSSGSAYNAPSLSESIYTASTSQQKIPSYKPTPISLLKNKPTRHIPIPYSPTLCKSSSILRKRSSSDENPFTQRKLKPDSLGTSYFPGLYSSTVGSSKAYEPDIELSKALRSSDDKANVYSPAPLVDWKDNGFQYTPSAIETLQPNTYVPFSKNPSEIVTATYEPSEKSKSSVEPTYEPLTSNGLALGETSYKPSRVSNMEPEYQPLCCDSTAKEYVPTDITELENIKSNDVDMSDLYDSYLQELPDEFPGSTETSKKTSNNEELICEVSSSDDPRKDVGSDKNMDRSGVESTKRKHEKDDGRKHDVKKRRDDKKITERRKSGEKQHTESAKRNDDKKRSDGRKHSETKSSSSHNRKKSEDKKISDSDKKRVDSKPRSEHEKKDESEKKKADHEKKQSVERKQSDQSRKKTESEKKRDSEKRNEHEKKKIVSSKHGDSHEKSSTHTSQKHKSSSSSNSDKKHSSKSNSSSQNSSKVVSEKKSEESKKHSSSKKSSSSGHRRRESIEEKLTRDIENLREEVNRLKRSEGFENVRELKGHSRKRLKRDGGKADECSSLVEDTHRNSESESEVSDREIFSNVTLPTDTWASSDEDSVTKECYRIFQEYEPSSAPKKSARVIEPQIMVDEHTTVSKKRVAHEGAENMKYNITVPKRPAAPSPSQVLTERFQKLQESLIQSQTSAPGQNILRSPPVPPLRSPPLPTAVLNLPRIDARASVTQSSIPSASTGTRKRIAHVPNVSVLLDAKLKMQQKIKEKQLSAEQSNKQVTSSTKAQSVTKGSARVAHMPSEHLLNRPIIKDVGGKIPANVRQNYLNILVDEYLKVTETEQKAFEKAEEDEKSIYSRSTTRVIYISHVTNTINRLRKGAQASSLPSSSTKVESKSVNKTVSHTSVLAGKVGTKGTWSIEKPRKPSITSRTVYEALSQYVMTEEQLKQNGFPMIHEEEKGVAVIHNFYKKPFIPKTPLQRMCTRCSKIYYVNHQGNAVKEENCVYHWGRLFQSKNRGGWEARYNCCQGHGEAIGCCVGSCHVSDNFDPTHLRGFVKTLPREHPPADGDFGVYALDCEMCYTTVGLELTRVTVVATDLSIVYESFVRPQSTILDYNTRFSGIKEEDLQHITTNIYEVQSILLSLINDKSIIIGHSLESDFKALKLIHTTVVDTSVVYPHKMGPPKKRALKTLCRDLLHKIIQESESGHDSAEDAKAAMEIMLFKVREDHKTVW